MRQAGTIIASLRRDLKKLQAPRGYMNAGIPRFNWLFGRDSLITAWQLLDFDPLVSRATLAILSKLQGKKIRKTAEETPGKILHDAHIGLKSTLPNQHLPTPYYGSVDATPLYLVLFGLYFRKTGDRNFVSAHWRNIKKATDWLCGYGDRDRDGFVEYQRSNPRGLYHQGWKDGFKDDLEIRPPVALVEVQGYAYSALRETASLAREMGNQVLQQKLERRAGELRRAFEKKFWMPEEHFFALALDGRKRQKKSITSNPGHLLFTGIVDGVKAKLVLERLMRSDLLTPYGIRTLSSKDSAFDPASYHLGSVWPHDNWIIAQGFKKLGYGREYEKIKQAILAAYKILGKIPEHYAVLGGEIREIKTACVPQAWSSGALLNFLTSDQ